MKAAPRCYQGHFDNITKDCPSIRKDSKVYYICITTLRYIGYQYLNDYALFADDPLFRKCQIDLHDREQERVHSLKICTQVKSTAKREG